MQLRRRKKKYWLQNGWRSFDSFLTHLDLTLEMRMAMDERKMKWDCKCGMFALVTFLKSGAREFTTFKIDKFVGTKLEVPKRSLLVSKTPVVFQETPEGKKIKFQGLIFSNCFIKDNALTS